MKIFLSLLLFFALGFIAGDYLNFNQAKQVTDTTDPLPTAPGNNSGKTPFRQDAAGNYSGTLTLTGYAQKEIVPEPFCEKDCKTYEYVFFTPLNQDNKALAGFMGINEGNSFVNKWVGLWCDENGIITYYNDSDRFGMKPFMLTPDLSQKILQSSQESPVTIELERLLYTSGRWAPACYSHFTYVRNP